MARYGAGCCAESVCGSKARLRLGTRSRKDPLLWFDVVRV